MVACPEMTEKLTLASVSQRLDTAIGVSKWLASIFIPVTLGLFGWLFNAAHTQGERSARIEQRLDDISDQQKKLIPSLIGDLLRKGPQTAQSRSTAGRSRHHLIGLCART
jgi:hypothetical protein